MSHKTTGRKPLELSDKSLSAGTFVAMIGHPVGLPMKVTSGATTRKELDNSALTTLDAFGGNSGSPVFDRADGKLIGMLVSGGDDFVVAEGKSCKVEAKCDAFNMSDRCKGEKVMKIQRAPIAELGTQYRSDSLLMESVFYNEEDLFQLEMFEDSVDLKESTYGWNLLHQAVFGGNLNMVAELIDKGIDLDATENSDNATALVMAIQMRRFEIANLLIESGANLDIPTRRMNDTALTSAIAKEMVDLAIVLVKKGARTDIPTKDGYTAVDLADFSGIYELTLILLDF